MLYTLAFKPSFLRQLLAHIQSEKQISLFGSSDTSLIVLLSKGVHLSPMEMKRITPVLDVFCSLFSHLLVTLDDSEFFNETEATHPAMPFTLSEVVDLASILRDVCIGLVELAYPDTRPNTSSFSFASGKSRAGSSGPSAGETRLWMHLFKVVEPFSSVTIIIVLICQLNCTVGRQSGAAASHQGYAAAVLPHVGVGHKPRGASS